MYKVMTYKLWNSTYKEAMKLLHIINNNCPYINDDSVSCDNCKILNKCKFVIRTCDAQPK